MYIHRHISIALLLSLLCYSHAHTSAQERMSENMLVPSVLRDYDADALFSYVFITQLAQQKGEKIASKEATWILNSDQQGIENMINNASLEAEQLATNADDNAQILSDILTCNLSALEQALEKTKKIMASSKIFLPRVYIVQRLWALRFDVASFKTLNHIDGGQELKLGNPECHALLSKTESLDTLHAQVVREFEKFSTLRETA